MEKRGGGTPVPEFPPGLEWMNAPPLRLDRELCGKVVVLDFWTYWWVGGWVRVESYVSAAGQVW